MIQAMADGGVLMGLPRQTALKFAAQTVAVSELMNVIYKISQFGLILGCS